MIISIYISFNVGVKDSQFLISISFLFSTSPTTKRSGSICSLRVAGQDPSAPNIASVSIMEVEQHQWNLELS